MSFASKSTGVLAEPAQDGQASIRRSSDDFSVSHSDSPTAAEGTTVSSAATSFVAAWVATFATTATSLEVFVPHLPRRVAVRALAHGHSLALHVAVGLFLGIATDLVRQRLDRRFRLPMACAFSAILGAFVAGDDFGGLAGSLPGPGVLWSHSLGVLLGVASPLGFVVARRIGRDWRAAIGVGIGALGLAVGHHRVLTSGYDGIHFAAVCCAASTLAGMLEGSQVLDRAVGVRPLGSLGWTLCSFGLLVGIAAFNPGTDVVVLARRLPGNALPELASRARQLRPQSSPELAGDSSWLRDRKDLPATPPSGVVSLPKDPIVILLTIDAVRADVMSKANAGRFPNFARLGAASVSFPRARTAAPHTTPSLAALMMGRYYSQLRWSHGKAKQPKPYDDKSPTIAEVLSGQGVTSAAFPALGQISEEYGLGRGFTEPAKRTHGGANIVRALVRRMKRASKGGLFLYSHIMEPHAPYDAPGATPFECYLGEIARVDEALGPLLDVALDSELAKRTVLIVSADHGEAFDEHGSTQHGTTLYEELMRVPLWIRIPGVPPGSSEIATSLVDVGPTIMDLLGASVPPTFMGESLLPALAGKGAPPERPLVLESGRMMRGLIEEGRWKLIADRRHGTLELYDLEKDPGETENLYERMPERAARLRSFLNAFFDVHAYRAKGYEMPYFP